MRVAVLGLGVVLAAANASAFSVQGDLAARGWFLSADGTANGTDVAALGFDDAKGAPEFRGRLLLGERHHLGVSYLRMRRDESAVATATILGVVRFDDPVRLDLSVDDVRFHYGYGLRPHRWLEVQPFLEVAYLHGEVTTTETLFGQTSHEEDSIVLPMPGLEVVIAPEFPVHLIGRAEGMAVGQGHLLDVQGGAEAAYAFFFAGLGYRYADLEVNEEGNGGGDLADLRLKGLYLEGGLRF
jgi:hypothetical protein